MGRLWQSGAELLDTVLEVVAYKTGIQLTAEQVRKLATRHCGLLDGQDEMVGVRSEEIEELVGDLLFKVGNMPEPGMTFPIIDFVEKYESDPPKRRMAESISSLFVDSLESLPVKDKLIDPTSFFEECIRRFGQDGSNLAFEFLEGFNNYLHRVPWFDYRRIEWKDTVELRDLFHSEGLDTFYGNFIDQRFLDYLFRNFDSIDSMNWRKFEGLTAEFFKREGFEVRIGPGRDDDNIDIRVWPGQADTSKPPAILIQCKREKQKVGKLVVKALWADILHEGAGSGLVVTTSSLSPGAKKTCVARGYKIKQANRGTLNQWITAMRSPYAGESDSSNKEAQEGA